MENFKVGDVVKPTTGPHKNVKHKIIHIHDNGRVNIQPIGLRPKQIKYRLGAATATPDQLIKETEVNEIQKD